MSCLEEMGIRSAEAAVKCRQVREFHRNHPFLFCSYLGHNDPLTCRTNGLDTISIGDLVADQGIRLRCFLEFFGLCTLQAKLSRITSRECRDESIDTKFETQDIRFES